MVYAGKMENPEDMSNRIDYLEQRVAILEAANIPEPEELD